MPIYGDPTAVVGRRVAAAAVDAAIVFGPAVAIEISRLEYLDVADTQFSDGEDYCDAYTELEGGFCADLDGTVYFADDNSAASSLLFFGLAVGMLVVLQGLTGFTVGKRLLGIRCVR
ncbi:MAG: hypothetical protein Q8K72_05440, partial [Acidimicrobiales bacterium]|nr:hypothetical protein [Acidimicrobiales bacterium]